METNQSDKTLLIIAINEDNEHLIYRIKARIINLLGTLYIADLKEAANRQTNVIFLNKTFDKQTKKNLMDKLNTTFDEDKYAIIWLEHNSDNKVESNWLTANITTD